MELNQQTCRTRETIGVLDYVFVSWLKGCEVTCLMLAEFGLQSLRICESNSEEGGLISFKIWCSRLSGETEVDGVCVCVCVCVCCLWVVDRILVLFVSMITQ